MRSPKLDPSARAILEFMEAQGRPPLEQLPLEEVRGNRDAMMALAGEAEPVARVEDVEIPGQAGALKLRIYTPEEGGSPKPAVLYFHGGGFVLCDLDTHDGICRAISRRSGAVVVTVNYRLAPENKYPAAVEDCETAARWVAQNAQRLNVDARRIATGGDSAGGNLATVIARRLKDSGGPAIALQVLIYPVTDLRVSDTPSMREFGEDHFLTRASMHWFGAQYLANPTEASLPDASPILAVDLKGLPPALVITGECDPLCSEGDQYAKRLEEAGVPVVYTCYPGMIHAFVSMRGVLPKANDALDQIANAVREMRPVASVSGRAA